MKKIITLVAVIALVAAIAITGTLAYLTATTDDVVNTFEAAGIAIDLDEDYVQNSKIYPGAVIEKEPYVTVKADSEDCYVYVQVINDFGTYAVIDFNDTNWTLVDSTTNIYRYNAIVETADVDNTLESIFTTVTIDGATVTETNIETVAGYEITIKAYAHQATTDGTENMLSIADTAAIAYFAPPVTP